MAKKRKYGIVTDQVIKDPSLSLGAKGLYSLLCTFANSKRTCFPSINTLAEYAGTSRRTIERRLKELEEKGYVSRSEGVFKLV